MNITLAPAMLSDAHKHADKISRAHNAGVCGAVSGHWIVWTVAHFPAVLIRSDSFAWDADGRETFGRYWTVAADRWTDSEPENIAAVLAAAADL